MDSGQTNPLAGQKSTGPARYRPPVARSLAAAVAVAALVAAGTSGASSAASPRTPAQVVRAWSKALNASDDKQAGALFARNAITIQGLVVVRLRTPRSATVWNSGLPCSGEIVDITVDGNVATATFRLGERKGHICDGPGTLAAARFTVVKGKITRWEQIPPPPPGTPVA